MKFFITLVAIAFTLSLFAARLVLAQSIVTGNATSITVVCNDVNNNTGEEPCTPTPTPEPSPTPSPSPTPTPGPSPTPTPTPTPGGEPTPTPTPQPSGGGGEAQGGGEGEAGVGGAAVSVPTREGEVLGLATTSGEETVALLFYSLGGLCLGIGTRLLIAKKHILA